MSYKDAEKAIQDRVIELAPSASALGLVRLAEALAWANSPDNAHGSTTAD